MGLADGPARAGAKLAIDLVKSDTLQFTTTTNVYNPLTDVSVPTVVLVNLKAVPAGWTKEELRDEPTRASMIKLLVAQLDIEESGVDIQPTTQKALTVLYKGSIYKVFPVKNVESGDETALVILGLRK